MIEKLMRITQTEKALAQLMSLHAHAIGRISALEACCEVLWKEKGKDPKALREFFRKEGEAENERFLLNVGDQHPELARIADVLKQLEKNERD